jgi:hemerythrin-like domain-containing protein
MDGERSRRALVVGLALGGADLLLVGCAGAVSRSRALDPPDPPGDAVTAVEDLMREHGALERMLLVYEECASRLAAGHALPPGVLAKTAGLVRRFIEDYHERLEEDLVFPRFEKAGRLASLVATLRAQHDAGRRITDALLALTAPSAPRPPEPGELEPRLRAFIRMYRPHAAREDTVLFPAVHALVHGSDYEALGDEFERREHAAFGDGGFEMVVAEVAAIERTLGIGDLDKFTPTA